MDKFDIINKRMRQMNEGELMETFNIWSDHNKYGDHIFNNSQEFVKDLFGSDVIKAIKQTSGNYSLEHKYAQIDFDGYLSSSDNIFELIEGDIFDIIGDVERNAYLYKDLFDIDLIESAE